MCSLVFTQLTYVFVYLVVEAVCLHIYLIHTCHPALSISRIPCLDVEKCSE